LRLPTSSGAEEARHDGQAAEEGKDLSQDQYPALMEQLTPQLITFSTVPRPRWQACTALWPRSLASPLLHAAAPGRLRAATCVICVMWRNACAVTPAPACHCGRAGLPTLFLARWRSEGERGVGSVGVASRRSSRLEPLTQAVAADMGQGQCSVAACVLASREEASCG
jgi:hypothetical protein